MPNGISDRESQRRWLRRSLHRHSPTALRASFGDKRDASIRAAARIACSEWSSHAGRSHTRARFHVDLTVTAPARHVWIALLVVYVVWGSTYFGIKIAVETIPPLLAAGSRFLVAGLLLATILALRGTSLRVTRRELGAS